MAELEAKSSDPGAVVEKVLGRLADNPELADGLFRANMHTNMAGELFVRDVELTRAVALQDPMDAAAFLDMDFPAAMEHFLARDVLSPEEFEALQDAERFRAFRMAREVSRAVTQGAKNMLEQSIEPGGPGLGEFIRRIQEEEVSLGFAPNGPGYLENVYRTSTATSYNAGRKRAQTAPDVVAAVPFLEYRTAGDGSVRPGHAALNGTIVRANEAGSIYPPNGFQCRCVMVSREDGTPTDIDEDTRRSLVDEGFRAAPDETIEDEAA